MTLADVLDRITLQALATAVALALSLFTFARQELGKRSAVITASVERMREDKRTHTTVVVHNSGPALARGVEVRFLGQDDAPAGTGAHVFGAPVDIPAGHSARLAYARSLGTDLRTIEVKWRDRRRGTQTLRAPADERTVPGTPVVNVEVTATNPPAGGRGPVRRGSDRF